MSDYLEGYGAGDERRGRMIRRILLALAAVAVLGLVGYFFLRDYSEKSLAKHFVAQLNAKQFDDAYRTWGCTDAHPCRDYNYARFLEDWGPNKSKSGWKITDVDGCPTGVIVTIGGGSDAMPLWIDRGGKTLGFSPWPECQDKKWRWKQFFQKAS